MPSSAQLPTLHAQLDALRIGLIDLAFTLDARGAHTAADVAMTTAAQLAEICTASLPAPSAVAALLPARSARRRHPPAAVPRR